LRLHAGAADIAPLTTLIDAARLLGEVVNRPAEACARSACDVDACVMVCGCRDHCAPSDTGKR